MRARVPSAALVASLTIALTSVPARAEGRRAIAPAGGGLEAVEAVIDARAGSLVVRRCKSADCSETGGSRRSIPIPIDRSRLDVASATAEVLAIGDAQVNFSTHSLKAFGTEHALSFYEVELLRLLSERVGQPVSRDEILQKIWGLDASPTNRTVDNFIVKLRKKIEKHPDKPTHILTVYGFGYKLVTNAS